MDAKSVITVNIVTPDGSVYDATTDLVVCKTTVGEIGIMPNHIPTLAALAIDRVRVRKGEEKFDEIAVSGGFMEFSDNTLSIVASAAEKVKILILTVHNGLRNAPKSGLHKLRKVTMLTN